MRIIIGILTVFILYTSVFATDLSEMQRTQFGANNLEAGLEQDTKELLEGLDLESAQNFSGNLWGILSKAMGQAFPGVKSAMTVAVSMMAVVLLCSMVTQMEGDFSKQSVNLAGVLAITLLSITSVGAMVKLGTETLCQLQAFTALLFPVLATATIASGGVTTAGAWYVGSVFASNVLIQSMNYFLVPMVYAYLAVGAAEALLGNHALKQMKALMKWLIGKGMKWVLYGFSAYLTLSGIVSGVGDATALKAAKLAMSTMVPVVGGMISDASETLLVSASMIRNGIGLLGLLAILAICILPLMRLTIQFLVLKITAAVSGTVGDGKLTDLMECVADGMGFLAGMTGTCGFMMLISCVCAMKAVSI